MGSEESGSPIILGEPQVMPSAHWYPKAGSVLHSLSCVKS